MEAIRVTIESRADCKVVDLPALIRANLESYLSIDIKGYADWERPSVFLDDYLHELTDPVDTPWEPKVIEPGFAEGVEIDFRWTMKDWEALLAECPEADPAFSPEDVNDLRRPQPWDVPLPLEIG